MAQSLWFGSHCGSPRFARFFYKLVGKVVYQIRNEPHAKWIRLEAAKITYFSEDHVMIEYPLNDSLIRFNLFEV